MKHRRSFTLMELLIIVALIAIIATVAIVLFDPMAQLGKVYDAKRKHELADLQKSMEDYYNDKGCYPKPADICYDLPPTNVCGSGVGGGQPLESQTCHICGNESGSPLFSPYLPKLPCDPQHKQKQYIYEVVAVSGFSCTTTDPNATSSCPQWYRVYSDLSNQSDSSIEELGCQASGCGMTPNYGYDYGVTSPNEKLQKTPVYYCYTASKTCNNCTGTYEFCKSRLNCKTVYASKENCCLHQPKPIGCF